MKNELYQRILNAIHKLFRDVIIKYMYMKANTFTENRLFKKELVIIPILSLILTLLYCYGDHVVFEEMITINSVIKYVFIFLLYNFLLFGLYTAIRSNLEINIITGIMHRLYKKNFQLLVFIFLLIAWLPHLIFKYPIGNHYDSYYQLRTGLGILPLTTHTPIFYTFILTFFYKMGDLLIDHNAGMFCFAVIKYILHAYVVSYIIAKLKKNDTPDLLLFLVILFYAFSPIVAGYIGTTSKDADYSFFVALLSVELLDYLNNKERFWNKENILMLLVASFFLITIRKNGIYLYGVCALIITIKECGLKRYKNLLIIVLSIILPVLTISLLNAVYKPITADKAEILSLPLQQTARLARYHPELITDEEKEIINRVIPYDEMVKNYTWYIFDPVKDLYKDESSTMDMINFLTVWFKCFFKSPITYVEATLSQNIYLLYPRVNDFRYYIDCNRLRTEDEVGLFQTPLWLKKYQGLYESFLWVQHEIPVLGQINNVVTYNIIFIFLFALTAARKKENLIVLIPSLISFVFCIIGPAIIANTRYCFPIVYSFPICYIACKQTFRDSGIMDSNI